MDRMLRADVVDTIRQVMVEMMEGKDEVWMTAEQLCAQFGMISAEWLHRYGELLPRERIEVVMEDGSRKVSRWAYPRNKIQRAIREGKMRELTKRAAIKSRGNKRSKKEEEKEI